LLEYSIKRMTGEPRHDLVSVTTNRGNLYTLSVSTLENRWPKVKDIFYKVATSFSTQQ
jgi:photosystem II oxygen-evolving enhancer protein 2